MSDIAIWTDGSAWKGIGGWACILTAPSLGLYVERSGHMPQATNNQAEMTGVLQGMLILLKMAEEKPGPFRKTFKEVTVITDSKYTIGAFTIWECTEYTLNKHLIREYKRLAEILKKAGCKMKFKWVRGHNGETLNERADELAGAARKLC